MGAVASHTPGFTTLAELWPALAFHTLSSFAGAALYSAGLTGKRHADQATGPVVAGGN